MSMAGKRGRPRGSCIVPLTENPIPLTVITSKITPIQHGGPYPCPFCAVTLTRHRNIKSHLFSAHKALYEPPSTISAKNALKDPSRVLESSAGSAAPTDSSGKSADLISSEKSLSDSHSGQNSRQSPSLEEEPEDYMDDIQYCATCTCSFPDASSLQKHVKSECFPPWVTSFKSFINELNAHIDLTQFRFDDRIAPTNYLSHRERDISGKSLLENNRRPSDMSGLKQACGSWSASEQKKFFYSVQRRSRWRPDLISLDIGTKTELEVCTYIQQLEKGIRQSNRLKYLSEEETLYSHEPVFEVSDAWVNIEERIARLTTKFQVHERDIHVVPWSQLISTPLATTRITKSSKANRFMALSHNHSWVNMFYPVSSMVNRQKMLSRFPTHRPGRSKTKKADKVARKHIRRAKLMMEKKRLALNNLLGPAAEIFDLRTLGRKLGSHSEFEFGANMETSVLKRLYVLLHNYLNEVIGRVTLRANSMPFPIRKGELRNLINMESNRRRYRKADHMSRGPWQGFNTAAARNITIHHPEVAMFANTSQLLTNNISNDESCHNTYNTVKVEPMDGANLFRLLSFGYQEEDGSSSNDKDEIVGPLLRKRRRSSVDSQNTSRKKARVEAIVVEEQDEDNEEEEVKTFSVEHSEGSGDDLECYSVSDNDTDCEKADELASRRHELLLWEEIGINPEHLEKMPAQEISLSDLEEDDFVPLAEQVGVPK